MKCPNCGAAELVRDTRDMPYTYKGEETTIPAVTADYCPACGEAVLDMGESARTSALMRRMSAGVRADGNAAALRQHATARQGRRDRAHRPGDRPTARGRVTRSARALDTMLWSVRCLHTEGPAS